LVIEKKGRIIIRNLVYDISSRHLRKLLKKFGEIVEVNIPKNMKTGRARGFAFVEFTNRNSAMKAVKVEFQIFRYFDYLKGSK